MGLCVVVGVACVNSKHGPSESSELPYWESAFEIRAGTLTPLNRADADMDEKLRATATFCQGPGNILIIQRLIMAA